MIAVPLDFFCFESYLRRHLRTLHENLLCPSSTASSPKRHKPLLSRAEAQCLLTALVGARAGFSRRLVRQNIGTRTILRVVRS
jgi:hypothetical protein